MTKIDFETAFGAFIECRVFQAEQNVVFSLVRLAFKAGWVAAGGEPPPPLPEQPPSVIEFPKDLHEKQSSEDQDGRR